MDLLGKFSCLPPECGHAGEVDPQGHLQAQEGQEAALLGGQGGGGGQEGSQEAGGQEDQAGQEKEGLGGPGAPQEQAEEAGAQGDTDLQEGRQASNPLCPTMKSAKILPKGSRSPSEVSVGVHRKMNRNMEACRGRKGRYVRPQTGNKDARICLVKKHV